MDERTLDIVLIEDDPDDVRIIGRVLKEEPSIRIRLSSHATLKEGQARLDTADADLVLLDLGLPDSHGLETFTALHDNAPHVPIIVLTGSGDEERATRAIQLGAQDYLVKGEVDSGELVRAIRYAIERHRLLAELESKNAELERFVYTVSHDLKSPLNTIKGFIGILERDVTRGRYDNLAQHMEYIVDSVERMKHLIDDLLELARTGRLIGDREDVPLGELVREAVQLLAGPISESGANVEIAPDLPTVYGDRVRLLEVVQNLLDNAVRFLGDQSDPRIEIGARQEKSGTVVSVRDNGIGIDPANQEEIFGLFDQLAPEAEGTGVGLAIAKRIVELHGGRVWVDSEGRGRGSTFSFLIPSKAEPAAGAE